MFFFYQASLILLVSIKELPVFTSSLPQLKEKKVTTKDSRKTVQRPDRISYYILHDAKRGQTATNYHQIKSSKTQKEII
jgi:hypothetical protein